MARVAAQHCAFTTHDASDCGYVGKALTSLARSGAARPRWSTRVCRPRPPRRGLARAAACDGRAGYGPDLRWTFGGKTADLSLGYEIVRLTWADLTRPGRVMAMVLAAAEQAGSPGPNFAQAERRCCAGSAPRSGHNPTEAPARPAKSVWSWDSPLLTCMAPPVSFVTKHLTKSIPFYVKPVDT